MILRIPGMVAGILELLHLVQMIDARAAFLRLADMDSGFIAVGSYYYGVMLMWFLYNTAPGMLLNVFYFVQVVLMECTVCTCIYKCFDEVMVYCYHIAGWRGLWGVDTIRPVHGLFSCWW